MKLMPCILILGARPKECKDTHTHTHTHTQSSNCSESESAIQGLPKSAAWRTRTRLCHIAVSFASHAQKIGRINFARQNQLGLGSI